MRQRCAAFMARTLPERVGSDVPTVNYPLPSPPRRSALVAGHWQGAFDDMKKGITAANTVTAPIDVWLGSLPSQPAALIGRAEELATARNQLLAPEVRLLTLVGP